MPDPTLEQDRIPARVGGRYRLTAEVGRGGMATVWRAHDEVLDRPVAVKLLHGHLASDPAFLDRFRREARAAGALSHPNVVAVHDWGETHDAAFLVLQLVDGPSLREVLRHHRRLDPREALAILVPAAAGLGAAHRAGLVHRDVKPENLLVGRDGTVRVTDFGLARAAASSTSTFGSEVLVGSPHYLSPEAVRGEPLGPRADVYALGIVLFECLTGQPPHAGDTPYATAVAHLSRDVPAPSLLVADVGPDLDEVVRRATAHEPEERYPDAQAFADALAAAVPDGSAGVAAVLPPSEEVGDLDPPPRTGNGGGTAVVEREDDLTRVVSPRPSGDRDPDDHRATGPRRRPRRRRRGWIVLLVLLALLGGSAAGGYLLWDRVLAPVTPIPEVLGAGADEAVAQLEADGFVVDVAADRPYDLGVAEGHVLEQRPTGAARVGETVTLVLSAGPRPVEIPRVAGETVDVARETLDAADLVVTVEERYDASAPEGTVIATDPGGGEVVDEASTVTVVVSLGPEPIEVPSVTGDSVDEAQAVLREAELELSVVERRHHEQQPAGTVLGQVPEPGSTGYAGDVVEVVVSDGPAPIEVPNVRGQRLDDAVAELESRGLDVEVERRGGIRALISPGRVYEQDPAPNSIRARGDTVLLYAYED